MGGYVTINISLQEYELNEIKRFCKLTGRTTSRFLVSSAIQYIKKNKNEEFENKKGLFWRR